MNFRALHQSQLLPAVVFLAATLVLAVQLITPSPVMISLAENGAQTTSVGEYFTYRDVTVITVAAFGCGSSATYLVVHDRGRLPTGRDGARAEDLARSRVATNGGAPPAPERTADAPRDEERWEETLGTLSNNEETIYELLIDADGELAQQDLVEESELSKATVSRTLDTLERKELLERKRNGMGNTIHLR